MKCVVCRDGETLPGTTSLTIERDEATLVVRAIPADVCENCGETYINGTTTQMLEQMVAGALRDHVKFEVRDYVAA